MAIVPVRWRFCNADKTVRLNCDSDNASIRIQKGIALGASPKVFEPISSRPFPGIVQGGLSEQPTEMVVAFRVPKQPIPSVDAILDKWDLLMAEVDRGGLIEYRPPGGTRSFWISFYPSTTVSLFDGDISASWWDAKLLEMVKGVQVSMLRHPEIAKDDGTRIWL